MLRLTVSGDEPEGPAETILPAFLQELHQSLHSVIPLKSQALVPQVLDEKLDQAVVEVGRHHVQNRNEEHKVSDFESNIDSDEEGNNSFPWQRLGVFRVREEDLHPLLGVRSLDPRRVLEV